MSCTGCFAVGLFSAMKLKSCHIQGRIYIARGKWHFWDSRRILSEDQRKNLPTQAQTSGNVSLCHNLALAMSPH